MSAGSAPVLELGEERHFPDGAAVVIGGSGGIGRAVCARLAEHGSDVALTYRSNQSAASEVAEVVRRAGRRAIVASPDLGDGAAVASFFASAAGQFGGIHTVVFAVGSPIPMVHVSEIEATDWTATIAGDLTGFYNVVHAGIPHLRASAGSFVAVSSAGLLRHPPKDVLSTVPKAGIEALLRAIAREEGRFGVRANAVALGVVEAGHFHKVEQELTPEFIDAMKRNTAMRRLGTAREAADAVVFLASTASSYTTGQSLAVDGGYSV